MIVAEGVYNQMLAVLRSQEKDPDPSVVLSLVEEYGISGYDAQFVALAIEFGVSLYTQDRELLKKFPKVTRPFYVRR